MTPQNLETIGTLSDTLDNILYTAKLPLPPKMHIEQLTANIEKARDTLRKVYQEESGENPWEEQPAADDT